MCGENSWKSAVVSRSGGSPPRVRGKQNPFHNLITDIRITPACAGKTATGHAIPCQGWDHPRVCGENSAPRSAPAPAKGSPPRVRGKRAPAPTVLPQNRITPACAGKTVYEYWLGNLPQDHPRVCGENMPPSVYYDAHEGSPPRVRGKRKVGVPHICRPRITPACAGKTDRHYHLRGLRQDHPRVCGENSPKTAPECEAPGSPPRVRGKRLKLRMCGSRRRITPACAGKTQGRNTNYQIKKDHPRVCGENSTPR